MHERSSVFDTSTAAGRLMAETDWAATPIGDPSTWPESLAVLVRTALSSRYPMLVLWGESYIQLYNDAYSRLIGDQHPSAMGEDCRVTLAEGWPVLGPLIEDAMVTGVASWVPALQLLLDRAGYREEAYFTVSHAPASDDEGVTRGVLTVCSEVTEQVVGERRLRLLQQLSLDNADTLTVSDVAERLVASVDSDPQDVPFVGIYLREGVSLRRMASARASLPESIALDGPDDEWGLLSAASGRPVAVPLPEGEQLVGGAFGDPVTHAFALPVPGGDPQHPFGVVVVGLSPSRGLDELYRSFLDLLVQQVGVAVRNALVHEEERARAAALAELDRAKTDFFTNVSHEFRTPLTLMLGPLEDALADAGNDLPPEQRERVATALRASRRLAKLVNNLLTFSSVEAGSARPQARDVDLAQLTADVAAGFRAAVERGGLGLEVDCPPLPRGVAVDVDHWETVVTNLLSNALKFTFVGQVRVSLTSDDDGLRLEVADSGVGIPAAELPHLFERFHRVRGARSRSHEGSGVGLSLVHELVTLMGGEVRATSEAGSGSTFTVQLPWRALTPVGEAGLPTGDVVAAAVEEAEGWLVAPTRTPAPAAVTSDDLDGGVVPRVLVADDNADMREHVVRLLHDQGWQVTAVADGAQALVTALADPPDLLLTDVMMPGLDGFELLRTLRADPRTATLPVVVLSARAGEGASTEGLDLGADDYVVKPFDSRDLVARLRTTMRLARQRREHVADLGGLAEAAAVLTSGRSLSDALGDLVAQLRELTGARRVAVRLVPQAGQEAVLVEAVHDDPDHPTRVLEVLREPVLGRGNRELGAVEVAVPRASAIRPETRALLTPLAGMLAAVVEEGWQAERDNAVAATLQGALLPERLPRIAGLDLAAAYRPAEEQVQVGGDWYDVVDLPDGRVALVVGDVAGHGLTSALIMGQLRAAVRAYAMDGREPHDIVVALDEFVARMPDHAFCTLFLGYLDVASGRLDWCTAGHPPPALLHPDGTATWLAGEPSPPLGAGLGVAAELQSVVVAAGGGLLAYTDGLIEDRTHQLDSGMPALLDALQDTTGASADDVLRTALALPRPTRADDLAVLVVRRPAGEPEAAGPPPLDVDTEVTLPRAPHASGLARRWLREVLDGAGIDDDAAFDLVLGLTEAVNNAAEHAVDPTTDDVVVRVRVDAAERTVLLEVHDSGQWRERRPAMDRGHGATLMAAAGDVRVQPSADGTRVTIERRL
ncbi:MAG: putative multi-sensor signal transduction histidine kinase [Nocardioides sp.]|nr:putative multi-sensor signal transduction histidine kinase [Nocardioides sp.]